MREPVTAGWAGSLDQSREVEGVGGRLGDLSGGGERRSRVRRGWPYLRRLRY